MFKLVVDDVLVPREFAPLCRLALAYLGLALLAASSRSRDDYLADLGRRALPAAPADGLFAHVQGLSLDFSRRAAASAT